MVKALKDYLTRFIELTEEDLEVIASIAEVRTYDKKVRLIDQGEYERYFNFIVKGLARKYFYKNGKAACANGLVSPFLRVRSKVARFHKCL